MNDYPTTPIQNPGKTWPLWDLENCSVPRRYARGVLNRIELELSVLGRKFDYQVHAVVGCPERLGPVLRQHLIDEKDRVDFTPVYLHDRQHIPKQAADKEIQRDLTYLIDWVNDFQLGTRFDVPPDCVLLLAGDVGYEPFLYELGILGVERLIMFPFRVTKREVVQQSEWCDSFRYIFPRKNQRNFSWRRPATVSDSDVAPPGYGGGGGYSRGGYGGGGGGGYGGGGGGGYGYGGGGGYVGGGGGYHRGYGGGGYRVGGGRGGYRVGGGRGGYRGGGGRGGYRGGGGRGGYRGGGARGGGWRVDKGRPCKVFALRHMRQTVAIGVPRSEEIRQDAKALDSLNLNIKGSTGFDAEESEAIQDVQSEIGVVDVSLSDMSMNTHPESQDASEPAFDRDGKQHVASEVREVLDAPTSEERSDAVIVAKESVSEADGLSCTNQQESERDETSRLVEKLPSHVLHEDAPSGNDTSVNSSDDTRGQGCSEDHGVDKNLNIHPEDVTNVNEKHALVDNLQENNSEGNLKIGGDVCLNSAEEAKESPTGDLSVNVSHESAAQSVKEMIEPHDVGGDGDTSREVNCGSEVNVTKTTASVASETKTIALDLESKVVTSTDTVHAGAKDCVDSQPAENEGGDAADNTDDKAPSTGEIGEIQKLIEPALDASEGHTVAAEIENEVGKLAAQLKHADDQKTQSRNALRPADIRATCKDYDISYKAAMAEERSARKAVDSKRQEIEVIQSVISRVKSAAFVNDIDLRMQNMEHMIQHETLSLREEKRLIREIKQLKQLCDQISSSMGTNDEVKQALDEKEKTDERLKVLRKELDVLRNDMIQT